MKTMPNKTDRNDARALAQIVRTGWFRQVHVKSRQCRLWRSLLVSRRTVLNEMRSIENVVRAVLQEAGITLGTPSRTKFAGRVRERPGDDLEAMPLVKPLPAILTTMLEQFAHLTKWVLDIARDEGVCRRLRSVPGVGPITALAFRARIDRPDRFKRSRNVGAHLRLTPAVNQSGETDIQEGRVSRCGGELARTAPYKAAHSLLVRSKKWTSLRSWGMSVSRTSGMAQARVAARLRASSQSFCTACGATPPSSTSARRPASIRTKSARRSPRRRPPAPAPHKPAPASDDDPTTKNTNGSTLPNADPRFLRPMAEFLCSVCGSQVMI